MKYTQKYRIYENDVDFRKMATLGTLLRYCQQIGAEDAEHYGITPELYASTHTSYVLAKLALHITRTPRVEETITVQTEPEALHRAVNRRFTTFCDAQGREEACVDSRWVLIDTDKRMILRKHPEGFPTTGWVDKLDRELPIKLTKVKREDCEELGTHRAVYSRCDRNGHMNNTVYADLICDALPLEVWRTHTVTDVILYYHKEVPMGESTRLYRAAVGENRWYMAGCPPGSYPSARWRKYSESDNPHRLAISVIFRFSVTLTRTLIPTLRFLMRQQPHRGSGLSP